VRTISQQVTSRTNLEKIIDEYNLYSTTEMPTNLDAKVEAMRHSIDIQVTQTRRGSGANSFTIKFQGRDAAKVADVTNALASNFISENLKIRESQALGTSSFIAEELESVEKRLLEKEERLKQYREKYMGGLPEQLETNLRILERLQGELEQLNSNLRDAENRRIVIQQQLADAQRGPVVVSDPTGGGEGEVRDVESLKAELASLEAKYTERHPDVIRLRKTIEKLETGNTEEEGASEQPAPPRSRAEQALAQELRDVELEVSSLRAEIQQTKEQTAWYQKKVEETPKREQELLSLERDYENLKELYDSLLERKLEAEMAVDMERKQKGEQFRIIDPAKIPDRPIKPNFQRILLMTLVLGLGFGFGLGYLREMLDDSYKYPEEAEQELELPVLVSLPLRYTEREIRSMRLRGALKAASVTTGFVLSVIAVFIAVKGVDATIARFKDLLDKFGSM
jgi:polysaccharide chain length determinant protein (PEP-CTERM system associated)